VSCMPVTRVSAYAPIGANRQLSVNMFAAWDVAVMCMLRCVLKIRSSRLASPLLLLGGIAAQRYGCQDPRVPGMLFCMALGQFVDSRLVRAAHLFKYEWRDTVSEVLGFRIIKDEANGMMVIK